MAGIPADLERIGRGNPPELQAKLDAGHERFQAMIRDRRGPKGPGGRS